jgi:threonine synthase
MPAEYVHDHLEQHHEIDHHEEDDEQRPEKLSEAQDHAHAPLGIGPALAGRCNPVCTTRRGILGAPWPLRKDASRGRRLIRAEAYTQNECFAAALRFARSEGIIPAPESSHAIKGAIAAAKRAGEAGTSQAILFNLSGHGRFDMAAYEPYLHGSLENFELPEQEIQRALRAIEPLPKPAVAVPLRGTHNL